MDRTKSQSKSKLKRALRKLRESEIKLARAERTVQAWRRKVADLTFENKCLEQPPLEFEEPAEGQYQEL